MSQGCLSSRRKTKGLSSAFAPPFPLFLRVTKSLLLVLPAQSGHFSCGAVVGEEMERPGLLSQTNAFIIRNIVRVILVALLHQNHRWLGWEGTLKIIQLISFRRCSFCTRRFTSVTPGFLKDMKREIQIQRNTQKIHVWLLENTLGCQKNPEGLSHPCLLMPGVKEEKGKKMKISKGQAQEQEPVMKTERRARKFSTSP